MKTSSLSHLQATIMSVVAAVATVVVAVVPDWSAEVTAIVAGIGGSIAALIPIINAVHALIETKPSGKTLEADVLTFAKSEVGKIDFDQLASDAIAGQNIESLVKTELQKLLVGLTPVAPPAPAPAVPVAPAPPTVG